MYITISRNSTTSVRGFVDYLDKGVSDSDKLVAYLDKEGGVDKFFNEKNGISSTEVVEKIDRNCLKLSRDEARFYSMVIAPSKEELASLDSKAERMVEYCANNGIKVTKEQAVEQLLQEYTCCVMDQYAKQFGREEMGINSSRDLVWYGRVESDRYYKWNSAEVLENKRLLSEIESLKPTVERERADSSYIMRDSLSHSERKLISLEKKLHRENGEVIKEMTPKVGYNSHIHVVVSRRNKGQTTKLSPLSQGRRSESHQVGGKRVIAGFNRDDFYEKCEATFDRDFDYHRSYTNSYNYHKEGSYSKEKAKAWYHTRYPDEQYSYQKSRANTQQHSHLQEPESRADAERATNQFGVTNIAKQHITNALRRNLGDGVGEYVNSINKALSLVAKGKQIRRQAVAKFAGKQAVSAVANLNPYTKVAKVAIDIISSVSSVTPKSYSYD
ncbi:MAG: MobB family relaxase [Rikenellaceae bacterium]